MLDKEPSEAKSLVELQVPRPQTRAAESQNQVPPPPPQEQPSAGYADAAAVLTAVDEDEEGGEEAEMPEEFDYVSDGEGGGED